MKGCVEWTGYLTNKGYGRLYLRKERRYMLAHRWVWEQANGSIPVGMVVMHRCDNRACIKLSHLRLGTQAENLADMKAKGRGHRFVESQTHCKHGHPFDDENTRWYTRDGYPARACRACIRRNQRAYRERLRDVP